MRGQQRKLDIKLQKLVHMSSRRPSLLPTQRLLPLQTQTIISIAVAQAGSTLVCHLFFSLISQLSKLVLFRQLDMGTLIGDSPPKSIEDGAKIPVRLAIGNIDGATGEFWENPSNSDTGDGQVSVW